MTQLVVDSPMRERLRETTDSIEFVDDTGRVLGFFCPLIQPPYEAWMVPVISDEERRQRLAQVGKYTTEEVLRHLESL